MDRTFGKYEVVEKIGEGGFGEVFKGWDPGLKRHVAIKTCTVTDRGFRERFLQEAEISARLQHPNIVTVHDFGEEDGRPYLVQELLPGEDLGARIARGDTGTVETRLDWLGQVAEALGYAHRNGVVHRDVKPGNVRIQPDGRVRILDFGIAMVLDSAERLTRTGMSIGTAAYLSPEQLDGRDIDGRADIFSFGALAYELFSGQKAFQGPTLSAVVYQVAHEHPPSLAQRSPGCPPAMVALVERCLAKSREERFRDFAEVARALDEVRRSLTGEGVGNGAVVGVAPAPAPVSEGAKSAASGAGAAGAETSSTPPGRRGRLAAYGGLGVAALAVAVFGVLNLTSLGEGEPGPDSVSPTGTREGVSVEERAPGGAGAERAPGGVSDAGAGAGGAGVAGTATGGARDSARAGAPDRVTTTDPTDPDPAQPPVATPAPRTSEPDPAEATPLDERRLLVVLYGEEGSGVREAETALLEGLRARELDVVDPGGLEIAGTVAPATWQAESLGTLARRSGAGIVVVATLRSWSARTVGRFFSGSASLDLRVHRTSDGELLGSETVEVGVGNTPGELGVAPSSARTEAATAVARQGAAAVRRMLGG